MFAPVLLGPLLGIGSPWIHAVHPTVTGRPAQPRFLVEIYVPEALREGRIGASFRKAKTKMPVDMRRAIISRDAGQLTPVYAPIQPGGRQFPPTPMAEWEHSLSELSDSSSFGPSVSRKGDKSFTPIYQELPTSKNLRRMRKARGCMAMVMDGGRDLGSSSKRRRLASRDKSAYNQTHGSRRATRRQHDTNDDTNDHETDVNETNDGLIDDENDINDDTSFINNGTENDNEEEEDHLLHDIVENSDENDEDVTANLQCGKTQLLYTMMSCLICLEPMAQHNGPNTIVHGRTPCKASQSDRTRSQVLRLISACTTLKSELSLL